MKETKGAETIDSLAEQLQAWESHEVAGFLARQPERQEQFSTLGGFPVKRVYTPLDVQDDPPGGHRSARPVSLHPGSLSHHVSGPTVDHAPDRGLRDRRRYQQAVQVSDPAGPDGTVHPISTCRP